MQSLSETIKGIFVRSGQAPCAMAEPLKETLARRVEVFLVNHRKRFGYLHLIMFVFFLCLYLIPPFLPLPPDDATPLSNYFLMVKFAVWGVWFPLILLSIIFFGRAWCGILCPQGALSEYASTKSRKNRPLPRWMTWEGTPILSFILITILGQMVGVRDYPKPMLLIFGGTMVLAAYVGYRYNKGRRAWCRHLCPVGLLLGIFSRLGIVGIEKKGQENTGVICPTYINLSRKDSSRHCIECYRCVNPGQKGTFHMEFRKPGAEIENVARNGRDYYEVMFLFFASGLALGGFHWITNPAFETFKAYLGGRMIDAGMVGLIGIQPPWWLAVNYPEVGESFNLLDIVSIASFMTLFMIVIGAVLSGLNWLSALRVGRINGKTVKENLVILGYAYAPVALLSLILGLGVEMFSLLKVIHVPGEVVKSVMRGILAIGVMWSVYLQFRLTRRDILAMIPAVSGIALITWAWLPFI